MTFIFKGLSFSDRVGPLVRHMPAVDDHRETLRALQGSWDTLSLLGHLSDLKTELGDTRRAFDALTGELMASLADETLARALSGLGYKAQVAVDILTRNLFERTADIGFLATDAAVVEAAGSRDPARLGALRARFRRYASRYSVYRDIVLLDPEGRVLARMNDGFTGPSTSDIVRRAASGGHVETYGATDFCGGDALTYAGAVRSGKVTGVLVLVFDLLDEARRIFGRLAHTDELLAFVDGAGRVVVSNDPYRLPVGHRVELRDGTPHLRLAGQTCVAVLRRPAAYQGYEGPGWSAVAFVPCDVAFEHVAGSGDAAFSGEGIFSERIRAIPQQARAIQRELDRVVWNGRLRQTGGSGNDFSRALLAEIAATGRRTQGVFEEATARLLDTAAATILEEARLLSGLAVDILDRNLYERACDCRWWTEDASLATLDATAGAKVLAHINSLYTVYTDIVLFDAKGTVVASSRGVPEVGATLDEGWVGACLTARGEAAYAVSPFAPTPLYGGAATYVYTAPIRVDGRVVGGVGLVFDATPQFLAMLEAALPDRAGSVAAFLRPDGSLIGCSGALPIELPEAVLSLRAGQSWSGTLFSGNACHAVGATASSGYREFKTTDGYEETVIAVVVVPCGTVRERSKPVPVPLDAVAGGTDVATFHIGAQRFGIVATEILACIEIGQAVRMPGASATRSRHHGYTPWQGGALPLVDMAACLGEPASDSRHAIVLKHGGLHFGLQVSELGVIVPLRLVPTPTGNLSRAGTGLVETVGRSGRELVPLLSVARIAAASVAALDLVPEAVAGV